MSIFLIPSSGPYLTLQHTLSTGISKSLVFSLKSGGLYLYLSEYIRILISPHPQPYVTYAIVKFIISYPTNKCKMMFCCCCFLLISLVTRQGEVLGQFCIAIVTNHHQLSVWKQHKFVFSHYGGQSQRVGRATIPSGDFKAYFVSLSFSAPRQPAFLDL